MHHFTPISEKISGGSMPPDPPAWLRAFGARRRGSTALSPFYFSKLNMSVKILDRKQKRTNGRRYILTLERYNTIFRLWRRSMLQSTLVISTSKGLSEIHRDTCTSTYQICRIEEKINRTTIFHKRICKLTPEVRDIQQNLNSSNSDGSFTVDDSNSFFSPYKLLPPIAQEKYVMIFSYFIIELYVVCTHKNRLIEAILMSTLNIQSLCRKSKRFP